MTRAITRTETHATRTTAPLVLSRITTSSTPPGLTGDRWTRGKAAVSAMTRDRPKKRRLLLARETTTPSARARIKQGPVVQSHGAFLADRARDRVTTTSALWPRAQLGWEVSHDTETHTVWLGVQSLRGRGYPLRGPAAAKLEKPHVGQPVRRCVLPGVSLAGGLFERRGFVPRREP